MDFFERFDYLLNVKRISAYRLAKEANINERIVGHWKARERKPSFDNLIKLADYFEVSIDYLVGRSDNPERM